MIALTTMVKMPTTTMPVICVTKDPSGFVSGTMNVPQIPASSSTDYIYLYYDHGSAADAQNPAAVWSNGYAGVWHLAENPSGGNPIVDSTGNLKNGGTEPISAAPESLLRPC